MAERAFVRRIKERMEGLPDSIRTWVQALRIGDLGIAAVPGELLVEPGLDLKSRSPFAHTMVIELANDSIGYIPHAQAEPPIVAGRTYELDFYAVGYSIGTLGPVEIGLTDSPTAFGTSIYTATPAGTGSWSHFAHSFEAPVNADYLTVRVTPDSGTYVAVDNFMLTPEPGTLGLLLIGGLALLKRRK